MSQKTRTPLALSSEEAVILKELTTSRVESSGKVQRARILLDYSSGETIAVIARKYQTNRPLVERCIEILGV